MTRDASLYHEVLLDGFSLFPTTERHLVELARRNGFNEYFKELFVGDDTTHKEWEAMFAKVR